MSLIKLWGTVPVTPEWHHLLLLSGSQNHYFPREDAETSWKHFLEALADLLLAKNYTANINFLLLHYLAFFWQDCCKSIPLFCLTKQKVGSSALIRRQRSLSWGSNRVFFEKGQEILFFSTFAKLPCQIFEMVLWLLGNMSVTDTYKT